MPRSKRDKKVSLTKTTKKGLLSKQKTIEEIRKCVDKYTAAFLFDVHNMRNSKLKDLRADWKDSRIFFGKNKVMALALGKTEADEQHNELHQLSKRLVGQCGLLFTSRSVKKTLSTFENFSEDDYARAGFKATEDVILPEGPLENFPHSIEPHLRQLGLPTTLQRGIVTMLKSHEVCKKDQILTPEQAKLLKLLDNKMAIFKLNIKCYWCKDSGFHNISTDEEDKIVENNEDEDCDENADEEMDED